MNSDLFRKSFNVPRFLLFDNEHSVHCLLQQSVPQINELPERRERDFNRPMNIMMNNHKIVLNFEKMGISHSNIWLIKAKTVMDIILRPTKCSSSPD